MANKPASGTGKSWLAASFKAGTTTTISPKHAPSALPSKAAAPRALPSAVSAALQGVAPAMARNAPLRPQEKLFAKGASMPTGVGLESSRVRERMVQRIAAQGTEHPAVLAAMGRVERHKFVDTALVNQAYEDTSLPIGLGQTISKPSVVARMLALLLERTDAPLGRVLEIGTGCGYQAAVLSHIAREVYSMERLKGLHDKARANLRGLQRPNIHLLFGDGFDGYPAGGPYAAIISAAGGEAVPQTWIDQLAVGGRLVAPTQTATGQQSLLVIDKTATGLLQHILEPVLFVPLRSGVA
jgi:protein-L-isoaspartate(D-aspartate) O-methyltransferase